MQLFYSLSLIENFHVFWYTGGLEVLKDHNFGIILAVFLEVLHRLPSSSSIPDDVIGIFQ